MFKRAAQSNLIRRPAGRSGEPTYEFGLYNQGHPPHLVFVDPADQLHFKFLPERPQMFFDRLIGIVPLGIGLTVLVFIWGSDIPLFGRMFASFVALFFVIAGIRIVTAPFPDPQRLRKMAEQMEAQLRQTAGDPPADPSAAVGYRCDSCGAPVGSQADVSPQGDVKCAHCHRWFNIHTSTRS
jgi:DNA-directed RNA polymerase subunit RPC12/RpoP